MMKSLFAAGLTLATVLAAGAASADTTYTVDKVSITGSRSVPTSKLLSAIQEHAGSRVSQADIVADQDAITKVLGAANVVGGIKTSMVSKPNKHIEVIFAVDDQGVQAPTVTKVAPKLHAEMFEGNKAITSDKLMAASGLNPGDSLTDAKVVDAEKRVQAAYAAAKLPLDVSINGSTVVTSPGYVDVTWHIVETKGKAKPKDDRSQDAKDQIQ